MEIGKPTLHITVEVDELNRRVEYLEGEIGRLSRAIKPHQLSADVMASDHRQYQELYRQMRRTEGRRDELKRLLGEEAE